uniref:hypothetical protein n=1 Tax=Oceanithermus sp. TaxID=2268145 RepID=UPI0025DED418
DSEVHLTSDQNKITIDKPLHLTLDQGSKMLVKANDDIQIKLDENDGDFTSLGTLVMEGKEGIQVQAGQVSFQNETNIVSGSENGDDGDIQIKAKTKFEIPCPDGKVKAFLVAGGKLDLDDTQLGPACMFGWSQDVIQADTIDSFRGLLISKDEVELTDNGSTFVGISKDDFANSLVNHLVRASALDFDALKTPASANPYIVFSRK